MTNGREVNGYLNELRQHLGPVTLAEREEIVREIEAHIRDAAEQNGIAVEDVLARLGPAKELAAQYRDGMLIRQASRSFSPLRLLQGAARMATRGVAGTIVFFAALLGYTTGVGLLAGALLKPFFPDKVGVFASQSTSTQVQAIQDQIVQTTTSTSARHEILGLWAIPLFLVLGAFALLATTFLIKAVLRESQRVLLRLHS